MDLLKYISLSPPEKLSIYSLPWRKIIRQIPPLAASSQDIKYGYPFRGVTR